MMQVGSVFMIKQTLTAFWVSPGQKRPDLTPAILISIRRSHLLTVVLGLAAGAFGVKESLAKYLPKPVVVKEGESYHLDYDRPESIGKIREFHGNIPAVLRAYSWIMSLGPEGILEVARTSVLNNNYLTKMLENIKGTTRYYAPGRFRFEQERWSWEKLAEDTSVGTLDIRRRIVDYGIQSPFPSHHPWIVPEPFTPEFCESYSIDDMEYWCAVLKKISEESYSDPDFVKEAPHRSPIHHVKYEDADDPEKWANTWRAYQKKRDGRSEKER